MIHFLVDTPCFSKNDVRVMDNAKILILGISLFNTGLFASSEECDLNYDDTNVLTTPDAGPCEPLLDYLHKFLGRCRFTSCECSSRQKTRFELTDDDIKSSTKTSQSLWISVFKLALKDKNQEILISCLSSLNTKDVPSVKSIASGMCPCCDIVHGRREACPILFPIYLLFKGDYHALDTFLTGDLSPKAIAPKMLYACEIFKSVKKIERIVSKQIDHSSEESKPTKKPLSSFSNLEFFQLLINLARGEYTGSEAYYCCHIEQSAAAFFSETREKLCKTYALDCYLDIISQIKAIERRVKSEREKAEILAEIGAITKLFTPSCISGIDTSAKPKILSQKTKIYTKANVSNKALNVSFNSFKDTCWQLIQMANNGSPDRQEEVFSFLNAVYFYLIKIWQKA